MSTPINHYNAGLPLNLSRAVLEANKNEAAAQALPEPNWESCLKISEIPEVDEAIGNLISDPTEDNAVCLVRMVLRNTQVPPRPALDKEKLLDWLRERADLTASECDKYPRTSNYYKNCDAQNSAYQNVALRARTGDFDL